MIAQTTSDNEGKKRLDFVRANRAALIIIVIGVILLALGLAVSWTYSGRATRLFYDYPPRYNRAYQDRVLAHQKIQKGFNPAAPANKTLLQKETLASVWSQQYNPPASRRDQTIANVLGLVGVAGLLLVVADLILILDRRRRGRREPADAGEEPHAPPSGRAPDEIDGEQPRHRLRDLAGLGRRTFTNPRRPSS